MLGVRPRLLRGSQLPQTLIPLCLGLVAAIGLGFLPLVAILRLVTPAGAVPVATLVVMLVAALAALAALAAASLVALATLPGIGGRLTPDLLRRD